jgi:hydroxyacylglutathione hydrolase
MSDIRFHLIACLSDNYAVLAHEPGSGTTLLVDAPEAGPILAALRHTGWTLTHVLVTHHHHDHVAGLAAVKAATGAMAIGPAGEAELIDGLDVTPADGETLRVGGIAVSAIATPGHTRAPLSYHLPDADVAFTGDTLFALGCGRVFEGTMEMMWGSLLRLRDALPPATRIYCGHEYTEANARFALSVDPDNAALRARAAKVAAERAAGRPTVPSLMADEIATNPFLRADDPALAQRLGLPGAAPARVFAELRTRKDSFR